MVQDTPRLVVVPEWTGKFVINEAYRPIAEALVKKYRELRHIAVGSILFIDNTEGTGKSRDKKKYAQTGKVPEKWHQVIAQLTGRKFEYYIEFFKRNTAEMSREQLIALVYHELRHIDHEGNLRHHEVEDWDIMLKALGENWATTHSRIPDLLAEDVNWDRILDANLFNQAKLIVAK